MGLPLLNDAVGTKNLQRLNVPGSDSKRLSEGVYQDLEAGNGLIDNGGEHSEQPTKLRFTGPF